MGKPYKILLFVLLGLCLGASLVVFSAEHASSSSSADTPAEGDGSESVNFPVKDGKLDTYEDVGKEYPMDLKNPESYTTTVEYDAQTGLYYFRTKVGDMDVITPFTMTEGEYQKYQMEQSMNGYWKQRIRDQQATAEQEKMSLSNIQLNAPVISKVFGPGGVQVKMQGSTELLFGFKINKIQNPTLSERLRKPPAIFDFDTKIQLNVNAKVGDKVDFNMNYNTESSFDFDQSKIKLAYKGKEDEIVQNIEAGNVSLPLNSSLIKGSTSLFGIKTEMKFGKLKVATVISQQESETKTVSLKNGAQTTKFQLDADEYDENRHYFLSYYFRNNFENAMSRLPYINSDIAIKRVEVWVTNKKYDFTQSRNIVAFMELGEGSATLTQTYWEEPANTSKYPFNKANKIYDLITALPNIRDIQQANSVIESQGYSEFEGGDQYEKVESARLLEPSEYTLNPSLGFISLKSQLNTDEVLAVAFEYSAGGKVYQVGEFSTDGVEAPDALMLKLLKGTALSPSSTNWNLMMKNIYFLGSSQIQPENFKLDVLYQSDSTGLYINYIPEGAIKNQSLLKVFKLDRLDKRNQVRPDGLFDFVDGYTIIPSTGRIIFPVLEPFGSDLGEAIADPVLADNYMFQDLYEKTVIEAREQSERNKFIIKGEYKSSSGSEIRLNAMNVPQGSVRVTAGGVALTENVDYTVDYMMGSVTILNQSILESGSTIDVSLESQSFFSMQRKSLVGTHLEYEFNKDFSLGATYMHLSEKPLTTKVSMGDEPISNTIWGLNGAYKKESQLLTNVIDKLPFLKAKAPSSIIITGEFAQLIPGHSDEVGKEGFAYLDDFEASKTSIDLHYPYAWQLASTPKPVFAESELNNNVEYGKNRALLAWYNIDALFTEKGSTTPSHISSDEDQLSNHYVRKVEEIEVFPNRQAILGQPGVLSVLNMSFYPNQRGPYNLDATNINDDGTLANPQDRWGGIMRRMEVTDFEAANVEYIEFWMMDPFIYSPSSNGGDLYFNLGEISEDILKDGKKSFENGMPADGSLTVVENTAWGHVSKTQSVVNAFDNDVNARQYQDVGLDGLRTVDEYEYPSYKTFVDAYRAKISPANLAAVQANPFSVLNDPAGDNYHYYRGGDYDAAETTILDRYKYYNGMEGNSPVTESTSESYTTSATSLPNVEDINQDNNLNEYERYYWYKVSLRPSDMVVGTNYISDKVVSNVTLVNKDKVPVTWYQFKIPIKVSPPYYGDMSTFSSIRFMRMYMTGFDEPTHLRFATLELVRGDWRTYTDPLVTASMDVSVVNIEENAKKNPVNYVLPPGITREQDPSQTQLRQQNEQSMALRITDLKPNEFMSVYKNITYDLRQYKRLQLFVHAEKLVNDATNLQNSDLTAFVRVGSDLKENYYEYEVPLSITPHGQYSDDDDDQRYAVWPANNMFDFPLSLFTDIKTRRNTERRKATSGVSLLTPFSEYLDPQRPANKVTIIGNPSLSDVQTIMIGVRNKSGEVKDGEVWINELRLSDFNEDGGYAALGNATINLSDVGNINLAGRVETAGFGGIEDNVMDRRTDDLTQYNIATNFELGRFFSEKSKVKIPMFYSYGQEITKPKYDPLNQDILLEQTIEAAESQAEKDSLLQYSQSVYTTKSFNLTNVKVDIKSKKPRIYDPANFALGYAYTESNQESPELDRNVIKNYRGSFTYTYAVNPKPWVPFKKVKFLNKPYSKIIGDLNINYYPSAIGFNTNLIRQYNETQLRDLNNSSINYSDVNNSLLSSSKDFVWDRKFDFKYDMSSVLKLSLTTATNARIQETKYTPVNKELFPDEFQNWKDTVLLSMANLGTPLAYQQNFNATYNVPIHKLPGLKWVKGNVMYNSTYTWNKGPLTAEDETQNRLNSSLGNTITNLGSWQYDVKANMLELYAMSPYLKRVNLRFAENNKNKQANPVKGQAPAPVKTWEDKIAIKKGKNTKLIHRLGIETVKVTAFDSLDNPYKLKFKVVDRNSIEILPSEDITGVKIIIAPDDPADMTVLENALQMAARFMMSVRTVSVNYNESRGSAIGGYLPTTGFMGQDHSAPGYLYTFGFYEPSFLEDAFGRNLLSRDSTLEAATRTFTSDLDVKMSIEPIPSLRIDLAAQRGLATQSSVQYVFSGMPTTSSGTFSISTIAVSTAFKKMGDSKNNYYSETFANFKSKRAASYALLNQKYNGQRYPSSGFISPTYANQVFDPANGDFSQNSAEVLIPAFISAYTGQNLDNSLLNIIPSMIKMLPNWRVTYSGLSKIPIVAKYFKSVNIRHAYNCKYNVGAFSTYANWVELADGYGFVQNISNENPIPASQFDIPSVSISERFNPLISLDITLKNSLSFTTEYRTGRNLALNIASTQLVESLNDEFVVGVGYRINDFDVILKLNSDKEQKVKNDLNMRLDVSQKDAVALIRKLDDESITQATSGSDILSFQFSADYVFSSKINLRLFYERQVSKPIISSTYPTSSTNFGISIKLLLTR